MHALINVHHTNTTMLRVEIIIVAVTSSIIIHSSDRHIDHIFSSYHHVSDMTLVHTDIIQLTVVSTEIYNNLEDSLHRSRDLRELDITLWNDNCDYIDIENCTYLNPNNFNLLFYSSIYVVYYPINMN